MPGRHNNRNSMRCVVRSHLNAGLLSVGACLVMTVPLSAQEPKSRATLNGQSGSISSLAFSPEGKTLASGDGNEFTMLWDVANGQYIGTFTDHGPSVAFSPDGKTLAGNGED